VVAEHPVSPRAGRQRAFVLVDDGADVIGPPALEEELEVEGQVALIQILAVPMITRSSYSSKTFRISLTTSWTSG
jgi:hypothetical protein